jgi:uncharacterized YigZ family protein
METKEQTNRKYMNRYPIPAKETRNEIRIYNSRFITTIAPAFSVDQAKQFIARIKEEFKDASHNVPAFVIGHGASIIAHCNDDGEPSGTAGRPALAVLQGSGLGDAAVVVTRYFGGKKLGTGGLVRAYSDSVRAVLEITPRAEKVTTHTVKINLPYNFYERVKLLIQAHHGIIRDEIFTVEVVLYCEFPTSNFPGFQESLTQISSGKLSTDIVSTNKASIIPIE